MITMTEDMDHGPCLTGEEYEKKIIELHLNLPPLPAKALDREVRRQELDLAIDHRLGQNFPRHRRDALWAIQQRIERKRLWLIVKYFFRRFLAKRLAYDIQGLAGYLVNEYANVLSNAELERYFGVEEARHPALPIDLDQLKK